MSFDDVISTLKGTVTGQPLISLWRHYPEIDMDLDKLVEITIKDYNRFPSDLIKLSPHARYCTMDFGCKIIPGTSDHGSTGASSCNDCIVKSPKHWNRIKPVDPLEGEYGRNIKYVERVAKAFPDRPIMMTIFAPTMVARKLSSNQFTGHLMENEKEVQDAFKLINNVTIEYAQACIDAGADGIFIATQEAEHSVVSSENLAKKILDMNLKFNRVMRQKATFTVLHVHGDEVYFNQALDSLPSTAINWHDTTSGYSIVDVRKRFFGGLLAGLEPEKMLKGVSKTELHDLRKHTEEFPFILSPGCVLLQGTKDKDIDLIFDQYRGK